jgi:SAM-dependent methyltransferase
MTRRDAGEDWRAFPAGSIPSKASTPQLDRFLEGLRPQAAAARPPTLLDVGCGTGRLARRLFDAGFSVVGVDISPTAIDEARSLAVPSEGGGAFLRFDVADVSVAERPRIDGAPFDVVVCQLVLSIVGGVLERENLLRHLHEHLRPGGGLYLSASGASDSINAGYARLYADDGPLTGEPYSYYSRDEKGTILYTTHHFSVEELVALLEGAGFVEVHIDTEREASSRRPDEAAFFHYVTCRRG